MDLWKELKLLGRAFIKTLENLTKVNKEMGKDWNKMQNENQRAIEDLI